MQSKSCARKLPILIYARESMLNPLRHQEYSQVSVVRCVRCCRIKSSEKMIDRLFYRTESAPRNPSIWPCRGMIEKGIASRAQSCNGFSVRRDLVTPMRVPWPSSLVCSPRVVVVDVVHEHTSEHNRVFWHLRHAGDRSDCVERRAVVVAHKIGSAVQGAWMPANPVQHL